MILIGRQLDFTLGQVWRKREAKQESGAERGEQTGNAEINWKSEDLKTDSHKNKWSAITRCAVVRTQNPESGNPGSLSGKCRDRRIAKS